ncbi:hypothetical protein PG999_014184 [Apiospora kogelbergensis]|uniref:Methyltransferase domain-containing protein n=2 Tax=Apiospora kogelbergensis TaxID=1337665 RepID=A0AAW0QHE5_9PEZI
MTGHSIPDPASVEENGRTYTGYYREGRYLLPNDGAEQDRLDLQHQVWRLLLDDALHLAPLDWGAAGDDARNVLDIGTGTGIWPIEFSEANPGARVVGTDLSLIQPPPDAVPPNCSFVREDSEEDEWVHEVEFDYIHMRAMLSCFTDHRSVINKIYDNLRPGGWFESQDFSFDLVAADAATEAVLAGSSIRLWQQRMFEGMRTLGRDLRVARHYAQWLSDAGFVDVEQRYAKGTTSDGTSTTTIDEMDSRLLLCPLNPWPRGPKDQEIGLYFETDIVESLEGMSAKVLPRAGMSAEEIQALVLRVEQDVRNQEMHAYTPVYVIYGRKPLKGKAGTENNHQIE